MSGIMQKWIIPNLTARKVPPLGRYPSDLLVVVEPQVEHWSTGSALLIQVGMTWISTTSSSASGTTELETHKQFQAYFFKVANSEMQFKFAQTAQSKREASLCTKEAGAAY